MCLWLPCFVSQAPIEGKYSLFMSLGNEKLPSFAGLGHVSMYMCQVRRPGRPGLDQRRAAERSAAQHGQRAGGWAGLGLAGCDCRGLCLTPPSKPHAPPEPSAPLQFPFDLNRPARPGTTKALASYDYVLLNSEFTDM